MIVIFSPTAAGIHHGLPSQVLCHSSEVISSSKISICCAERGGGREWRGDLEKICGCGHMSMSLIYKSQYHFNSIALQDLSSFHGAFSLVNHPPGRGHCQSHWGDCGVHGNSFIFPPQRKMLENSCAIYQVFSPTFSADRKIPMAKVFSSFFFYAL